MGRVRARGRSGDRARAVVLVLALVAALVACGGTDAGETAPGSPSTSSTTSTTRSAAPVTRPAGTDLATAPTTAPPPPDVEVTLAFGGDILPHMPINEAAEERAAGTDLAYDFGPMLAPLAPIVGEADLALCHLEVPLVAEGQAVSGYPTFRAPRELATAIHGAGFDGCSTASNHSLDGGLAGIAGTLDTFDLLGLGHAGTARSEAEASGPRTYEVGGARIAHLSYSYGFNGIPVPEGAEWSVDAIDPARIADDARAAVAFGAQLVVVSLHWGDEYRSDPSGFQQDVAAALAPVPEVGLVIGHHAHVVQPVEQVGDTWVAYGLGNQLANQPQPPRRDGLTLLVTVGGPAGGALAVRHIEAVPTYVDLDTFEVLPVAETLGREDLDPARRAELEASLARTMEAANRRGAGLVPAAWG